MTSTYIITGITIQMIVKEIELQNDGELFFDPVAPTSPFTFKSCCPFLQGRGEKNVHGQGVVLFAVVGVSAAAAAVISIYRFLFSLIYFSRIILLRNSRMLTYHAFESKRNADQTRIRYTNGLSHELKCYAGWSEKL